MWKARGRGFRRGLQGCLSPSTCTFPLPFPIICPENRPTTPSPAWELRTTSLTLVFQPGTFLTETMAWTASHRAFQSPRIGIHSLSEAKGTGKVNKQTPKAPGPFPAQRQTDLQVGGMGLEWRDASFIHYPAEGNAITPSSGFMLWAPNLLSSFPRLPPS